MKFDTSRTPRAGWPIKPVALLAALLLFTGVAPSANALDAVASKYVPNWFPIPPGMHIDDSARGDLNGDGLDDFVLVLDPDRGNFKSDTTILVAIENKDAEIEKVGSNDKLPLPDYGPSGGMEISIEKKGVLVIDVRVGSRSGSEGTWRFRLDPKKRRMRLIGLDILGYDVDGSGTKESTNYLTGKRITETFVYSEKKQARVVIKSRTTSVATPTTFLEQVTSERLR